MTLSMARGVCLVWLGSWHVLVLSSGHVPSLLLSLLLNFKVNISDGMGNRYGVTTTGISSWRTSGIWPFIEYKQYKKLLASKDNWGILNFMLIFFFNGQFSYIFQIIQII